MRSQLSRAAFKDDQCGAITVMGVFMASFLIGILFYMIGTGDAILYREHMQDAADATAFSAAVYDARGMNIIALINLIMAGILAVLILLNLIVLILAAVGFFFPPADAIAAELKELITDVGPIVTKVLTGMDFVADGVAVAVPWVAFVKSIDVANEYGAPSSGGVTAAVSQIPWIVVKPIAKATPGKPADYPRLGLPVSNWTFTSLCREAGQIVDDLFDTGLNLFHIPGSGFVESILDTAFQIALQWEPSYFCGGGAFDETKATSSATTSCKQEQKEYNQQDPKPTQPFQLQKCIDTAVKGAKAAQWKAQTQNVAPKIVFQGAFAGDDYFTVYGWAWGNFHTGGDGGVNVGAWHPGEVSAPGSPHSFAKAEFFYDKGTGSSGLGEPVGTWLDLAVVPESVSGIPGDAMYNMRWRARMRRYRWLTPPLGGAVAGASAGDLRGFIKDNIPAGEQVYNVLSVTGLFALIQDGFEQAGVYIDKAMGDLSTALSDDGKVVH
jgi:hypothetical protein